jgi:hypothetical protein
MTPRPPKPVVKSILACREMFRDDVSGEFVLVGPLVNLTAPQFPLMVPLNLFAVLTSMRGRYLPTLQLRDEEDQVCWSQAWQAPAENHDPLAPFTFSLRNLGAYVPRPGKYDVVLLLNDEEAGRHGFVVHLPVPAAR